MYPPPPYVRQEFGRSRCARSWEHNFEKASDKEELCCCVCTEAMLPPVCLGPCGHLCCATCSARPEMTECPLCRDNIVTRSRVIGLDDIIRATVSYRCLAFACVFTTRDAAEAERHSASCTLPMDPAFECLCATAPQRAAAAAAAPLGGQRAVDARMEMLQEQLMQMLMQHGLGGPGRRGAPDFDDDDDYVDADDDDEEEALAPEERWADMHDELQAQFPSAYRRQYNVGGEMVRLEELVPNEAMRWFLSRPHGFRSWCNRRYCPDPLLCNYCHRM